MNPLGVSNKKGVWIIRQSPAANVTWRSVAYGNGIFVAVGYSTIGGTSNVMTSSDDGVTWVMRVSTSAVEWRRVTFGNGVFVAVGSDAMSGTTNRSMYSVDGITWTAANLSTSVMSWEGLSFGGDRFVAVASTSTGVSTNNGASWITTSRTTQNGRGLAYGDGLFVSIGLATSNYIWTSPDGNSWMVRTTYLPSSFMVSSRGVSITFGDGKFVIVTGRTSGASIAVNANPTNTNWTQINAPAQYWWSGVAFGKGIFVAVAREGTGNRSMWSKDGGNTWELLPTPADNDWEAVGYGNNRFVAVASSGSGNRVMTMDV